MRTEESVKCSESRGIKYLTVREQGPWDRIFYYSMEAEVRHVPRYKGGHSVRTAVFISSVKLQRDPDPNVPPSPSLFNISPPHPPVHQSSSGKSEATPSSLQPVTFKAWTHFNPTFVYRAAY